MPTRLFIREPKAEVTSLAELVGIANALETEAVRRYTMLAEAMDRRGETATAATFRDLLAEEEGHVGAVGHWAASLGKDVPPPGDFVWRLPPELGDSWDEVAGSALLTPYRALSIAVVNEQRAFAFYAYIVANATDPEIAREAEHLAREELAHAALLRRKRRLAYRRERPDQPATAPPAIETPEDFRMLVRRLEGEAATVHAGLAARFEAAGDPAAARLLTELAQRESRAAGLGPLRSEGPPDKVTAESPPSLYRAIEPLERMAEIYEHLAEQAPSEAVLGAAQEALTDVVARLSAMTALTERLERS